MHRVTLDTTFVRRIVFIAGLGLFFTLQAFAARDVRTQVQQLFDEAREFYDNGYYINAEVNCKKITALAPQFYPAYNLLGDIYVHREEYEWEAINCLKKSVEINPRQQGSEAIYGNLAALLDKVKEPEDALRYLDEGLTVTPNSFDLNLHAGIIYLRSKNDPHKARAYLTKAYAVKPQHDRMLYLLGVAQLGAGEKFAALESVTKLRANNNEYLATELENVIRQSSEGEQINMEKVLTTSTQKKPVASPLPATMIPEREPPHDSTANAASDSATNVSGRGVVTIKTQFKNPQGAFEQSR